MKLIIANWKMNPATEVEAIALAKASDLEGLIIAPPFPFLGVVKNNIKNAKLGAQDLFWEKSGAFTGEVSALELKSLGVEYVIIGHSERRAQGETDEIVAKKVKAALDAGLIPVLCVGESAVERASGQTESVISRQLSVGLSLLYPIPYTLNPFLVVAYEPLWAIGSKNPNTPQDTKKMLQYIKGEISNFSPKGGSPSGRQFPIKVSVIYGGSVDSQNAESFLKEKGVEGLLVGGTSLKADQIIEIVEISLQY